MRSRNSKLDFNIEYQRCQRTLAEFSQFWQEMDKSIYYLKYNKQPVLETKNEGLTM